MQSDFGSGWLAGAASRQFPVGDGTPLTGYVAREGPTVGTHDPLTIGALVLERDGGRLVIVAADVAAVDGDLAREIASAAGIARAQLALCASHTHSGPAGVVARLHPASPDERDPALRARFVVTAAETIAAARRDLQAVDLLFGMTEESGVAANRNDPARSANERLSVLATRRGDGTMHCALVHFACHPTILGAASRVVSANFPGAMRVRLAELLSTVPCAVGVGTACRAPTVHDANAGALPPVVLYVNGAAGDLSTRFTRLGQDVEEVARMGGVLAEAARQALREAQPLGGPLLHGWTSVALVPRTSRAYTRQAATRSLLRRDDTRGDFHDGTIPSLGERRIAETRAQGEAMLANLAALPDGAIAKSCQLDAWRLGEVVLVSVPGELFASFGKQIANATDAPTLVLGYTNGYVGYLADGDAFAAGTYEALASPYGPEEGEQVVTAAAALATRLRSHGDLVSAPA